jgi:GDP-D-mannose 3',5'-epimerase
MAHGRVRPEGAVVRTRAVVTGAGGFIGHHLVTYLKANGYWVRGVDVKHPEYEASQADEFELLDLRDRAACLAATQGMNQVFQLAADMGGIGYITAYHADVARNNVLINAQMLEAARENAVSRYFYSSSACVYPMYLQQRPDVTPLREADAYPADPEEGYGWEKLYAEKLCEYYDEEGKIPTRVARFHNIYGALGTYEGGREKAPAAICRKVALAPQGGSIEVWGDGSQTRSFTYIEDCVEGIDRIMRSDHAGPLNLGSDELISVDGLVDLVCRIAGKQLVKVHDASKPQGVRGRNSDNTLASRVLAWQPSTTLENGFTETYRWIASQVKGAEHLVRQATA